MYKKPKCCIVNNNFTGPYFIAQKGVSQGDSLSLTIFVLCIEYKAQMLRQSNLYQGLRKVSLFADDTVIHLNGNPIQFEKFFDLLEALNIWSVYTINY